MLNAPGKESALELPPYRLLTGPDDAGFCIKVSAALRQGYVLHGSPCAVFDGTQVVLGQAVILASLAADRQQTP